MLDVDFGRLGLLKGKAKRVVTFGGISHLKPSFGTKSWGSFAKVGVHDPCTGMGTVGCMKWRRRLLQRCSLFDCDGKGTCRRASCSLRAQRIKQYAVKKMSVVQETPRPKQSLRCGYAATVLMRGSVG